MSKATAMRQLVIMLTLLLSAAAAQDAAQGFTLSEGDLLKLRLKAVDEDGDRLSYTFTPPLNESGEWQTGIGDAGEYPVTITVSDGKSEVTQDIIIRVQPAPAAAQLPPPVQEPVQEARQQPEEKQNHPPELEPLADIAVTEGEKVRIRPKAMDGDNDKITITYSGIVDEDGEWQTRENDAGEYQVTVVASDGKDSVWQVVKVTVNRKRDIFPPVPPQEALEGSELSITLPGEQGVQFSLGKEISGATLSSNVLRYQPDVAVVGKNLVAKAIQRLGISYTPTKKVVIPVRAAANGLEEEQDIVIMVKDANQQPLLEISDANGTEGQWIELAPAVADPDGDWLRVSYEGWMQSAGKQAGYGDAGDHVVTITVSDGRAEVQKQITVHIRETSRMPSFQQLKFVRAAEGDKLAIPLYAADPDNDQIMFSIAQGPADARIEGSTLFWEPGFEVTNNRDTPSLLTALKYLDFRPGREIGFTVAAVDSAQNSVSRSFAARIYDKNQEPRIMNIQPAGDITVAKGARIVFSVNAADGDDDELIYTWIFGTFDKQRGGNAIARTFTSRGVKKILVKVSDGEASVSRVWRVKVI
ncbi:hypothetical protein HY491_04380 [Candidatus Woesearchaeota archaeon]|nr:hypothetical protein [Candidatus Woesearchaeota archaeon]